jgi:hypothetical protein
MKALLKGDSPIGLAYLLMDGHVLFDQVEQIGVVMARQYQHSNRATDGGNKTNNESSLRSLGRGPLQEIKRAQGAAG